MFALPKDYSTLRIVDFGLATETSVQKFDQIFILDICSPSVAHQVMLLQKFSISVTEVKNIAQFVTCLVVVVFSINCK